MCEMGLEQKEATVIYQDNEVAIQIAINRGALSKQSRHIDRRVLASRNKIEDGGDSKVLHDSEDVGRHWNKGSP